MNCPFCGKQNIGVKGKQTSKGDFTARAYCQDCDATGPIVYEDTQEKAVTEAAAKWTERKQ